MIGDSQKSLNLNVKMFFKTMSSWTKGSKNLLFLLIHMLLKIDQEIILSYKKNT